ncbi:ribonuclease HII [Nonlabens marinus]|uniref:Ribonuclease HII n=1 Tax=Nonlabens marinus S1-08 TaxID=1454201 RepID=W8W036_9FLAO|nr:ribonuclease HII [Nonlabens marinus]BAO55641.1 ribonuclease HII [Nonlabens marinus S1-08]
MTSLKEKIHLDLIECGTDEAGRGCLAGPVTAAAVILPQGFVCAGLTDSKTLSRKRRNQLREVIEKEALCYHVAHVHQAKIDEINILNASLLAMHLAIDGLKIRPEHIAVDGNRFHKYKDIPATTVIKGDGKYLHIAAASILAKTYRDEFMEQLDKEFPQYKWQKNQGYPTAQHRSAIREHGTTIYHRMSFKLLPEQLKLPL